MRPQPDPHPAVSAPDPLQAYSALERLCQRMLDAARDDDWDQVGRVELDARRMIDALRRASAPCGLDGAQRKEKFRILRRIVLIDAQLRHLEQPWQRNLDALLTPRAPGTPGSSRLT